MVHPSVSDDIAIAKTLVIVGMQLCNPTVSDICYSAASLAPALFRGLPSAFFSTGARNFPV
jgi:hypothetical protein